MSEALAEGRADRRDAGIFRARAAAGSTLMALQRSPSCGRRQRKKSGPSIDSSNNSVTFNPGGEIRTVSRFALSLALALSASSFAQAGDLPSPDFLSTPAAAARLYDPTKFEIRGGFFASPFGVEQGSTDVSAALVFPKVFSLSGWQDVLIPRLRVGGVANLSGRTSYAYADGLWTLNVDRVFAEVFFGGLVHDGPLQNHIDNNATALGCRELYHLGADLGYRFDQHWSVIATFEHGSDGEPVLSNCPQNRGLNVAGVALGYSF